MSKYRFRAQQSLARARVELASTDEQRLKYAALELRMTIESITYDRALAYKDEFPPREYETWQPKKVLRVLLEIDPHADSDSSWSFGLESLPGEQAAIMRNIGSESVCNLAIVKRHYDALGNFLHIPSIKQALTDDSISNVKLRQRCQEIADSLNKVLSSTIFNSTLGVFSKFECVECKNPIRKRLPQEVNSQDFDCFNCEASYTLARLPDGQVRMDLHQQEVPCANTSCGHQIVILRREMEAGRSWTCVKCKGRNVFQLGLSYHAANA